MKLTYTFLFTLMCSSNLHAENRIYDYADIIPEQKEAQLEKKLEDFYLKENKNLIVITSDDIKSLDLDNSSITFIVAIEDKLVDIKGMDNIEASIIVHDIVIPRIKANNPAKGIEQGVDAIINPRKYEYGSVSMIEIIVGIAIILAACFAGVIFYKVKDFEKKVSMLVATQERERKNKAVLLRQMRRGRLGRSRRR